MKDMPRFSAKGPDRTARVSLMAIWIIEKALQHCCLAVHRQLDRRADKLAMDDFVCREAGQLFADLWRHDDPLLQPVDVEPLGKRLPSEIGHGPAQLGAALVDLSLIHIS